MAHLPHSQRDADEGPSRNPRSRSRSRSPPRVRRSAQELLGVSSIPKSIREASAMFDEEGYSSRPSGSMDPKEFLIQQLKDSLICPVHHGRMEHPCLLACSHSICKKCLPDQAKPTCPVCQKPFPKNPPLDATAQRLIESLFPYCCPRCQGKNESKEETHRRICPRAKPCPYAPCTVYFYDDDLTHVSECSWKPVACVGCRGTFVSSKLQEHHLTCDEVVLCCHGVYSRENFPLEHNLSLGSKSLDWDRWGKRSFTLCKRFSTPTCAKCEERHSPLVGCASEMCVHCGSRFSADFLSTHQTFCPQREASCSLCLALYRVESSPSTRVSFRNLEVHHDVFHSFETPFVVFATETISLDPLLQCLLLGSHVSKLLPRSDLGLFSIKCPLELPCSKQGPKEIRSQRRFALSLLKTAETPTSFQFHVYHLDEAFVYSSTSSNFPKQSIELRGVACSSPGERFLFPLEFKVSNTEFDFRMEPKEWVPVFVFLSTPSPVCLWREPLRGTLSLHGSTGVPHPFGTSDFGHAEEIPPSDGPPRFDGRWNLAVRKRTQVNVAPGQRCGAPLRVRVLRGKFHPPIPDCDGIRP